MPARKKSGEEASALSSEPPDAARRRPLPRLETSPVITHGEVFTRIEQGGCLRGVVVEAQDDGSHPRYAVFLLSSWRKEYTVLGFNSREIPRFFRGLDRIIVLVRSDYGFTGTVAVRLASEGPFRSHSWRITQGTDFTRATRS